MEILCSLADGTLVALDAPGAYQADVPLIPDGGIDGGGGDGGMGGMGVGGMAGMGMSSSSSSGMSSSSSSGMAGASSSTGTGGNGPGQEGGCDCRAAGNDERRVSALALLFGLGMAALQRRRSNVGAHRNRWR